MTAKFEVDYLNAEEDDLYESHKFLLEIDSDGTLGFPDYEGDIEYDILMESMGDEPTWPLEFAAEWRRNAITMVYLYMDLLPQYYTLLAADFAEHVLPTLNDAIDNYAEGFTSAKSKARFKKHKKNIEAIIESSRTAAENSHNERWVQNNQSAHNELLGESRISTNYVFKATDSMTIEQGSIAATSAGESAQHLIGLRVISKFEGLEESFRSSRQREILLIAKSGLGDASTHAIITILHATKNDVVAVNAEHDWQIRHFVHAMECVQSGRDWPSIKETP